MNATKQFYTTGELADKFGVDRKTATRWCSLGLIETERFGRDYLIPARAFNRFKPPTGEDARPGRPTQKKSSP